MTSFSRCRTKANPAAWEHDGRGIAGMLGCPRQLPDSEFRRRDVDGRAGKAPLLAMELELSRACNFTCVYCPFEERSTLEEELSEREVREVILQAKELGAKRIVLVGGEPTIHRDFLGVIRFIRSQDLEVEIFTNGSAITTRPLVIFKSPSSVTRKKTFTGRGVSPGNASSAVAI